jgi:hypothetical protein
MMKYEEMMEKMLPTSKRREDLVRKVVTKVDPEAKKPAGPMPSMFKPEPVPTKPETAPAVEGAATEAVAEAPSTEPEKKSKKKAS